MRGGTSCLAALPAGCLLRVAFPLLLIGMGTESQQREPSYRHGIIMQLACMPNKGHGVGCIIPVQNASPPGGLPSTCSVYRNSCFCMCVCYCSASETRKIVLARFAPSCGFLMKWLPEQNRSKVVPNSNQPKKDNSYAVCKDKQPHRDLGLFFTV